VIQIEEVIVRILLIVIHALAVSSRGNSLFSQSCASPQQSQAALKASGVTHIASTWNLVHLITVALIVITVLVVGVLIVWLLLRIKVQPKRQWISNSYADWEQISQPQPNALGPALLNLVLTQMMQSQQEDHQRDIEQFWTAQEPGNDFASFSDNSWDM
jgi:hypothetical protein